jgi:MYXO-CTERM domain-containing protein
MTLSLVLLAGWQVAVAETDCEAEWGGAGDHVPSDGVSDVPLNVSIYGTRSVDCGDPHTSSVSLDVQEGEAWLDVPMTTESFSTFTRDVPSAQLVPNTTYRLTKSGRSAYGDSYTSEWSFTTGDALAAPLADSPVLDVDLIEESQFGSDWLRLYATVAFSSTSTDVDLRKDLSIVHFYLDGQTEPVGSTGLDGLDGSFERQLAVDGSPEEVCVFARVQGPDGSVSGASNTVCASVAEDDWVFGVDYLDVEEKQGCGCASSSSYPGLWFLAMLAAAAMRRGRMAHRGV